MEMAAPPALGKLNANDRVAAFAPPPTVLPATDFLFDAWALTTIKGKLPSRPPVEPYLHGISDYDPPQTTIAWRREVELLTQEILEQNKLEPEEILDLYPLKPHEELRANVRSNTLSQARQKHHVLLFLSLATRKPS